MSGGFSIENLDVWHWYECADKWFGHLRPFPGHSDWKIWEVKFFFNGLSARLTNHPYMAFPNLEPPLVETSIFFFRAFGWGYRSGILLPEHPCLNLPWFLHNEFIRLEASDLTMIFGIEVRWSRESGISNDEKYLGCLLVVIWRWYLKGGELFSLSTVPDTSKTKMGSAWDWELNAMWRR